MYPLVYMIREKWMGTTDCLNSIAFHGYRFFATWPDLLPLRTDANHNRPAYWIEV